MNTRIPALILSLLLLSVNARAAYLHRAVKNNDLATLSVLLEDPQQTGINTPLKGGATALHVAAVLNRVEAATMLLARGADLNARTDGGFTPLHWAADRDCVEAAQVLIKAGADVNATTPTGITPLHWAARRNASRMVRLLLSSGAVLGSTTANGFTPLHWAVMKDADETAMLIAYKAVSDEMENEEKKQPVEKRPPATAESDERGAAREPRILPNTSYGSVLEISLGHGETLTFVWVKSLGLWVGQYEVTNGQFRRFRPDHKSLFFEEFRLDGPGQPVVYVSWDDAAAFCEWMNTEHGDRIPQGFTARLPTENEWVAFARCGDSRVFPWGDDWPPKYGNYSDLTARRRLTEWQGIRGYDDGFVVTCPVTQSGVNEWGIHGLAGNVWEWCEDWYDDSHSSKVRHGGSWDFDTRPNLRIDARGFDSPDAKYDTIGFRVVVSKP
jgi:hypothetical protein